MSFLAPWFVIAGVAAVALPVLFHLFRRTPRGRMPFSSLMFLVPSPPRVTSRSRLENWPLLLLRALVLVMLALTFGRPLWRQLMESNVDAPAGARTVLVVDTSASMRRGDLWTRAVAEALRIVDAAGPRDELAVLTFDAAVKTPISFEAWRAAPVGERSALVRATLDATSPGWSATQLDEALVAAADLLSADDAAASETATAASRQSKHVAVVTDLQTGSRTAGLQGYQWPAGIDVKITAITAKSTNAGIHPLETGGASTVAATEGVRPRVLLTNSADSARESFAIAWESKVGPTTDSAAAVKPAEFYIAPGRSRVVRAPPPTGDNSKLVLTGDDEPFDNALWVVPPQRERIRLLLVADEKADDPQSLRYFLERAFSGDEGTRTIAVETVDPHAAGVRSPTKQDFDDVGLVVVAHKRPLPETWTKTISAWIDSGGAAMAVLQSADDAAWRSLPPADVAGESQLTVVEGDRSREYDLLSEIDLRHPLFAAFNDPKFSDFTKIRFWRHRRLSLDATAAVKLHVVARFDSGDPAIVEAKRGSGRVFILTSGWQPRESQLGVAGKFVPLMTTLVELGPRRPPRSANYEIGRSVDIAAMTTSNAVEDAGKPWIVKSPAGRQTTLSAAAAWFTPADGPGIYELQRGAITRRIAVNVPSDESKTSLLGVEALEALGVRLAKDDATTEAETLATARTLQLEEMEAKQQLWRPLLAAALALIIVETWYAGRIARREAHVSTGEVAELVEARA